MWITGDLIPALDQALALGSAVAGSWAVETPFGMDLSIESMRSKEYSVGIFWFLVFAILVFVVIIGLFMFKKGTKLKTGEKFMFAWIILGVIGATIFGATQLLHGFLF